MKFILVSNFQLIRSIKKDSATFDPFMHYPFIFAFRKFQVDFFFLSFSTCRYVLVLAFFKNVLEMMRRSRRVILQKMDTAGARPFLASFSNCSLRILLIFLNLLLFSSLPFRKIFYSK